MISVHPSVLPVKTQAQAWLWAVGDQVWQRSTQQGVRLSSYPTSSLHLFTTSPNMSLCIKTCNTSLRSEYEGVTVNYFTWCYFMQQLNQHFKLASSSFFSLKHWWSQKIKVHTFFLIHKFAGNVQLTTKLCRQHLLHFPGMHITTSTPSERFFSESPSPLLVQMLITFCLDYCNVRLTPQMIQMQLYVLISKKDTHHTTVQIWLPWLWHSQSD